MYLIRANNKKKRNRIPGRNRDAVIWLGSGGRIRTCDLGLMKTLL